MIMTFFGPRNPVEEAKDPEKFRSAIREVLREGGTAEHLIAPTAEDASQDLVAVVPQMISYLGQGGPRYRALGRVDHEGHAGLGGDVPQPPKGS